MRSFQQYFQKGILEVTDLNHTGNNQIFKVRTNDGNFILKQYKQHHMDGWPRGNTEFTSLSFLWNSGFREIPRPVSFFESDNIGVYSYVSGKTLGTNEVAPKHVNKLAGFLGRIHRLGNADKSLFEPASSACFSLDDYLQVLDRRFEYVSTFKPENDLKLEVKTLLYDSVKPEIFKFKSRCLDEDKQLGSKLSLDAQVLTPADFGFHNALFSPEGAVFVDFEYFGRDDPARQVLDFLHHDKSIGLHKSLADQFLAEYKQVACPKDGFDLRLHSADPLVGMAWVLIYLNPFSDKYSWPLGITREQQEATLGAKLGKAKAKLNNLRYFSDVY